MIRVATADDVDRLQEIEDAADRLLIEALRPDRWDPAPPGADRARVPGILLAAVEDGEAVGFAHVLEIEGAAHLEQVAVLPEHGRRGHGGALVEAARSAARGAGRDRLTLRTYADVPFNAPFYAAHGFAETTPDTVWLRALVESERRLGLDRWGRRVQMTAVLVGGAVRSGVLR